MNKKTIMTLFLLIAPMANALEIEILPYDLNWQGNTQFAIITTCQQKTSEFKEGDITQTKIFTCIDQNCYETTTNQFVIQQECNHHQKIGMQLSPDNNLGIFALAKKRQDKEWKIIKQEFYSGKQQPIIQHTIETIQPIIQEKNWLWLLPIGTILLIASLILMKFTKRKIAFPLFLSSLCIIIIGLIL